MSPEAILTVPVFSRTKVFQENVICLAVDEAHLVEKWYVFFFCGAQCTGSSCYDRVGLARIFFQCMVLAQLHAGRSIDSSLSF